MFIYQIGNVVTRGFATHSTPVKWRNQPTQNMTNSVIKFNSPYSLPEIANYSISGELTCYNGISPVQLLNRLVSLGGRPYIDIIGYLPNDCCRAGEPCANCCGDSINSVRWFHTFGVISDISREYSLTEDVGEQLLTLSVSLSLQANPFWSPLSKYLWFPYYGSDELTVFELDEANYSTYTSGHIENTINTQQLFSHPSEVTPFHFEPEFVFYKRRFDNEFELYDPQYWDSLNVSGKIKASNLSTSGSNSNYYVSNSYSHIRTLHAFSNLPTSGILEISVDTEITPFSIDSSTNTIDLAELNSQLQRYQPKANGVAQISLTTSMILYAGTNVLAPTFIMLNGYPLLFDDGTIYSPPFSYKHRCPAELVGINNHIVVTKPDVAITVGYYHELLLN